MRKASVISIAACLLVTVTWFLLQEDAGGNTDNPALLLDYLHVDKSREYEYNRTRINNKEVLQTLEIINEQEFQPFHNKSLAQAVLDQVHLPKLNESFLVRNERMDREAASSTGIHLVTTFFYGGYHEIRFKEIVATFISNIENPNISYVHLLYEKVDPRYYIPPEIAQMLISKNLDKKLILKEVMRQPTYKELFSYANQVLQRGAMVIVANADIYFDATVGCCFLNDAKDQKRAFALSRRRSPLCLGLNDFQNIPDICEHYVSSHDAFILAVPIDEALVHRVDHWQNQGYGAENIVIYELKHNGYQVLNPCISINAFHFHCDGERHYDKVSMVTHNRYGRSHPRKINCEKSWLN